MLLVALGLRVARLTTNESLSVEDGVFGVGVEGVLRRVTDSARDE